MMKRKQAIDLLTKQRALQELVISSGTGQEDFMKWRRDTEVVIRKVFGDKSRHQREFSQISYIAMVFPSSPGEQREAFNRGMARARALLTSLVEEVEKFGLENDAAVPLPDVLSLVEKICSRFHAAARQLQSRHGGRTTLSIADEYDVQDLLHGFLRLHFLDIRVEEWTPSFAGASSRVDFLLKDERIVIEVKKSRATLKGADIGKELAVDIARYRSHPDCDCLVCFVYDPGGHIGNPSGIERDLEKLSTEDLKVRVIIAPKD
ncbi:PD-(D/E)XK nuclease domain-containing protein [Agrobacterium pusense]|uniref:PD-(D/E)XK nuclease domain-containing protein n=1 Tax=Agrobacterium pusense TaxID=648995 RepID=UPI0028AC780E|nr:hypothetical protein [Agrobacterium pusense]